MGRTPLPALASVALLCAWIGAAALVAAVVAPAAFAVLPSRTLAGALVGRVLPVLFWSGMLIGTASAALTWSIAPGRAARSVSAFVMVASCAIAQLAVSPRIENIRRAIGGPIDALARNDERRVAFGRLHGVSIALLGLACIGALAVTALAGRAIVWHVRDAIAPRTGESIGLLPNESTHDG